MRFRTLQGFLASVFVLSAGCANDKPAPVKRLTSAPVVATPVVAAAPVVAETPPPVVIEAPLTTRPAGEIPLPATFAERMRLGRTMLGMRKPAEAIYAFQGAAELDPESAQPFIEIARVEISRKDFPAARVAAEAAVKLAPESSAAWNTFGRVALAEGELDDAVSHFEHAVEMNEQNGYAWNNLGLCKLRQGKWDDAIEALESAVATEDAAAFMWNNLGAAYERVKDVEQARSAYEKGAVEGSALAAKNLARLDDEVERTAAAEGETETY
jgi:tetratricopeptide (TPR) repeat protein